MTTITIPTTWTTAPTGTKITGVVEWLTQMQRNAQQSLDAWAEMMRTDPVSALRTQSTIHDAAWAVKLTGICLNQIPACHAMSESELIGALIEEMHIWQRDAMNTVLSKDQRRDDHYNMAVAKARVAAHLIKWFERI